MSPGHSDRSRLKQIGCAALVLIGLAVFVPRTVASAGIPEGVWLIENEAAVQIFDCRKPNAVRSARSARRIAEFLSAPNETISDIHLGYWTTHKGSKVHDADMPRSWSRTQSVRFDFSLRPFGVMSSSA
jgi:hypothetical protein